MLLTVVQGWWGCGGEDTRITTVSYDMQFILNVQQKTTINNYLKRGISLFTFNLKQTRRNEQITTPTTPTTITTTKDFEEE